MQQRPLAIVVVGGMLVGSILLLLAVPVAQALFLGGGEPTQSPAEEAETV